MAIVSEAAPLEGDSYEIVPTLQLYVDDAPVMYFCSGDPRIDSQFRGTGRRMAKPDEEYDYLFKGETTSRPACCAPRDIQ